MEIKVTFLQYSPILYLEIIKELIEKRKCRSRTDFVNKAIKEKLEREGVNLNPKEKTVLELDWDKSDYFPKMNRGGKRERKNHV